MKLIVIILIATGLQAAARPSDAQDVTLSGKNIKLNKVFKAVRKQTDYQFFYKDEFLRSARPVNINVKDVPVKQVLDLCFKGQPLTYSIINNKIIVVRKNLKGDARPPEIIFAPITGTVVDSATGEPLVGVTIKVKGTTIGAVTDANGHFTLDVPEDAALVISSLGYTSKEISVNGRSSIQIKLSTATTGLNQLVVVGYGTQKKATVTGAISTIDRGEIVTTKNANIQNMLTGKIPGVRISQRTALPGKFDNAFDIRGMGTPLIVIDGVPRTMTEFQRLNPNDIANISVLKDASAAIYGVRAANGVILVTTRDGADKESTITYSGNYTWQFPSGLPQTVNIYQYMTLRNEMAMHNINGGTAVFSDQDFEDYRTGKKQSTDWYPLIFSTYAPETQHNLSASGGNDKIKYYVGAGYLYQGSFFESGDLNYSRYNLRVNLTSKISQRLTLDGGINLIRETQNRPYQDAWWIIRSFWRQGPQIPAYANNDPTKLFHGLIEGNNPISFMRKDIVGYKKYTNSWIQPTIGLKYEIPGIEGLYAKTLFSYDYTINNRTYYRHQYHQYRYDEAAQTFNTYTLQSPNRIVREAYFKSQILSQTTLNYEGLFNRHYFKGTLIWEVQKRNGDNLIAQRDLSLALPYLFAGLPKGQIGRMNTGSDDLYESANMGLAGRVNYNYAGKYLASFLFRYDGSSKFANDHQWGFFPGGTIGWRISEENFIKNSITLSFINQLKLRASYGIIGDDGASSYQWVSGYNYPTSSSRRNFTGGYVFDGNFVASVNNAGIPNPNITWFTAKTFDAGIDFEGWNGLLGFTVDYFNRIRTGLLARRFGGIPTVVGASLPQENLNSDRTYGYDLGITHRNTIGELTYNLKGILSYTRVKSLHVESRPFNSSWDSWKNNQNDRLQNVFWGLTGNGRFESWEDIWSNPIYTDRGTVPGDYKYDDWNGDGQINGLDVHPYQLSSTPWLNFSLIGSASFKGFDLSFLLQGSALSTVQYEEQLRQPLWGSNQSGAMVQFMNRWHPANPAADPYDPATKWMPGYYAYTGTLPDVSSSFNSVNGSYLRLKSVEIGYSLPSTIIKRLDINQVRVYINGYNLVTLTKVKYIDPEHPSSTWGYIYPLNKTVSAGINITF